MFQNCWEKVQYGWGAAVQQYDFFQLIIPYHDDNEDKF